MYILKKEKKITTFNGTNVRSKLPIQFERIGRRAAQLNNTPVTRFGQTR
jgi:hypothetical protein